MLNFRFKNPYRADEPPSSDEELNKIENLSYEFKGKSNSVCKIYEFDNRKLLAPKGFSIF